MNYGYFGKDEVAVKLFLVLVMLKVKSQKRYPQI